MKEIENIDGSLTCLICRKKEKLMQVNEFYLCKVCFQSQTNQAISIEKSRNNFFPEINKISEKVFLGNYDGQREKATLKYLGISHVLACGANLQDHNNGEFGFLQLEMYDMINENLFRVLKKGLEYMAYADKVYVHCHAGISRSASVVIAFFMWKEKMKFKEALDFVRKRRTCIFPNSGFYRQLEEFGELLEKNDYELSFLSN